MFLFGFIQQNTSNGLFTNLRFSTSLMTDWTIDGAIHQILKQITKLENSAALCSIPEMYSLKTETHLSAAVDQNFGSGLSPPLTQPKF